MRRDTRWKRRTKAERRARLRIRSWLEWITKTRGGRRAVGFALSDERMQKSQKIAEHNYSVLAAMFRVKP